MTKVNIVSPVKWATITIKKFRLDYDTYKLVHDTLVNHNIDPVVLAMKRYAIIAKIPVEMHRSNN